MKLITSIASIVIWIVAIFYAYGAVVHILNICSLSGFDWPAAPLKWQILDIVYLIVDLIVVVGLFLGWKAGYAAFFLAAISQIFLYTVFRDWIINVPPEFAVTNEQVSYLTTLVVFHGVTLIVMAGALKVRSMANNQTT